MTQAVPVKRWQYSVLACRLIIMIAPLLCITAASAKLTAKLDRTLINENESVQLMLRFEGQADSSNPDFNALQTDFDVVSRSRQQQYNWSNGKGQSYTDWTLSLMPRRAGALIIPSLNYLGDVSNALQMRVRSAKNATTSGSKPAIFTETLVEKERVYVQEQILLTQRLCYSLPLTDMSLTPLTIEGATVQEIAQIPYQKRIDGVEYSVIEVRYAIFPQNSGALSIPKQRFNAFQAPNMRQFGGFLQRGNQVVRTTSTKKIEVVEPPKQMDGYPWLPSSQVELTEIWSGDLGTLRVGEPITRSITVTAAGLTGAQIHPLKLGTSPDYRLYPDQAQIETRKTDQGTLGVRIESMAMVPNRAGQIRLPPIELVWWNTRTQRTERASIDSRVLEIATGTSLPETSILPEGPRVEDRTLPSTLEAPPSSPLLMLSLVGNGLLLCLTSFLFLRTRGPAKKIQRGVKTPPDRNTLTRKQQLKRIRDFANNQDLVMMRSAILDWAAILLPESPPSTLQALAARLGDPALAEHFALLDKNLYSEGLASDVDLEKLLSQLKQQSIQPTFAERAGEQPLKPLYPKNTSR